MYIYIYTWTYNYTIEYVYIYIYIYSSILQSLKFATHGAFSNIPASVTRMGRLLQIPLQCYFQLSTSTYLCGPPLYLSVCPVVRGISILWTKSSKVTTSLRGQKLLNDGAHENCQGFTTIWMVQVVLPNFLYNRHEVMTQNDCWHLLAFVDHFFCCFCTIHCYRVLDVHFCSLLMFCWWQEYNDFLQQLEAQGLIEIREDRTQGSGWCHRWRSMKVTHGDVDDMDDMDVWWLEANPQEPELMSCSASPGHDAVQKSTPLMPRWNFSIVFNCWCFDTFNMLS